MRPATAAPALPVVSPLRRLSCAVAPGSMVRGICGLFLDAATTRSMTGAAWQGVRGMAGSARHDRERARYGTGGDYPGSACGPTGMPPCAPRVQTVMANSRAGELVTL